MKLLILTLHELTHIQKCAEIELRRVLFFVEVNFMFVPMIFLCFLNVLDPMLYLFLLF